MSKGNVAFFVNFDKTVFFHAIGNKIAKQTGSDIFWVSGKQLFTKWLLENGVHESHILDITFTEQKRKDFLEENTYADAYAELLTIEPQLRINYNYIYLMDRTLRHESPAFSMDYFVFVFSRVKAFYKKNNIKLVFSEVTHAAEALTAEAARFLQVEHYHIVQLTIPGNRFAFFEGYTLDEVLVINKQKNYEQDNWMPYARDLIAKKAKPYTFVFLSTKPKFKVEFITKFVKHVLNLNISKRGDQTAITVFDLIRTNLRRIINSLLEKIFIHFKDIDECDSYFIYFMQRQPEATIDLYAGYFANQVEIIKNICRCLPKGEKLYIKLHPNGIGEFSFFNLYKISKLPQVEIIKYEAESFKLIENCQAVITVNGTVGIEASLKGKQVLMLEDYYYKDMHNIKRIKNFIELRESIIKIRQTDSKPNLPEIDEALNHLYNNSFDGIIGDPITTPGCLDEINIDKIVAAILSTVQLYKSY